jgi:putative ATP-binding cassette transporter
MAGLTVKEMPLFRKITLILDPKQLLLRFWESASHFWRLDNAWATGLAVFLIVVVLLQLLLQILLNQWNRHFFDSLERKDAHALWVQAQLFVPLALASILLAAASVWGRMTTQRSWREALTRQVVGRWLDGERFRKLTPLVRGSENPEYRIAVDIRIATDAPVDLVLAFFSSLLTALAFFGVLWTVGGSIDVVISGRTLTIPGYLVLGVIVYSGTMSALMIVVGHHLTSIIERSNQAEAEFRAAVDAFGEENANNKPGEIDEATAGDAGKRDTLMLKLQTLLIWWREFCWQLVRTTLVSQLNVLFAPVVAWLLCTPKYLSGAMSLGELTQAAAAFVTVQGAFNWLVDNYQRLADWRSSAHRVATLLVALDELEAKDAIQAKAPAANGSFP